jgi:hypothetical protein
MFCPMIAERTHHLHVFFLGAGLILAYPLVMHRIIFALVFFAALPALAGQTEARVVAMTAGCKPTKIEVARQTFGSSGATTYRVTCENKAPKAEIGQSAQVPSLMVRCQGRLCTAF